MKNSQGNVQMEKSNINVTKTQEVNQASDEPKTPLEMVKKIVSLADKGFQLTFNEEENENFNYDDKKIEKINILFSDILNESSMELLPLVEKISDFEKLTDDLNQAGDILSKIINYIDEGFTLTDISDEQSPNNELHILFAEMLLLSDTELRLYIPTPVKIES